MSNNYIIEKLSLVFSTYSPRHPTKKKTFFEKYFQFKKNKNIFHRPHSTCTVESPIIKSQRVKIYLMPAIFGKKIALFTYERAEYIRANQQTFQNAKIYWLSAILGRGLHYSAYEHAECMPIVYKSASIDRSTFM